MTVSVDIKVFMEQSSSLKNIFTLFLPRHVVPQFKGCKHVNEAKNIVIYSKAAHKIANSIAFQSAITLSEKLEKKGEEFDPLPLTCANLTASQYSSSEKHSVLYITRQAFANLPPHIEKLPEPSIALANAIKFIYINSCSDFVNLLLALQTSDESYSMIVVDNCTQSLFPVKDDIKLVAITSLLSNAISAINKKSNNGCVGMVLLPSHNSEKIAVISHLFDCSLNLSPATCRSSSSREHLFYELIDTEHNLKFVVNFDTTNEVLKINGSQ